MAQLYTYWRSTAAYRVRIALELKGVEHELIPVDLKPGISAQQSESYAALNPQRLVPFFVDDVVRLPQSMAILDYLDRRYQDTPLLPEDPQRRGEVLATCLHIACDVHPLNNLGVLQYLEHELDVAADGRAAWYARWIHRAFVSIERTINEHGGPFVYGEALSMADLLLVPQVYNAHRFDVNLADYPNIRSVESHCLALPAFDAARPENQPDAPIDGR